MQCCEKEWRANEHHDYGKPKMGSSFCDTCIYILTKLVVSFKLQVLYRYFSAECDEPEVTLTKRWSSVISRLRKIVEGYFEILSLHLPGDKETRN
jgi:hypothetical protein